MGAYAFGGSQRGSTLLHPAAMIPVPPPGWWARGRRNLQSGLSFTVYCRAGPSHTAHMPSVAAPWFLYLLECRNGSYYAGITNDVNARFQAHVNGKGARYTRANPPVRVLASRAYPDRSAASRAEWQIKRLPRARKLVWLQHPAE